MIRIRSRSVTRLAIVAIVLLALATNIVHAQFFVYDPTNYAQALARYAQLLQEYRFMVAQARRTLVAKQPTDTGELSRGRALAG